MARSKYNTSTARSRNSILRTGVRSAPAARSKKPKRPKTGAVRSTSSPKTAAPIAIPTTKKTGGCAPTGWKASTCSSEFEPALGESLYQRGHVDRFFQQYATRRNLHGYAYERSPEAGPGHTKTR